MTGHILRALWPINDDTDKPWPALVREASDELGLIAARSHAIITGTPTWRIAPASHTPGSGNLTRFVLIADVEARPAPARDYRARMLRLTA